MKYLKTLGLAACAAGALMALSVGTASATTLDCSASTACSAPTTIHAVNSGIVTLDAAIKIECEESTVEGSASAGGASATPNGAISELTFKKCGGWTVTVIEGKKGTLEVHTDANDSTGTSGNGTLTSNGAEVTVEGFGLHCVYGTKETDIGTVTGSKTTGSTAKFDIAANIERVGGRSGAFCGGKTSEWTGSYSIDNPMYLDVT